MNDCVGGCGCGKGLDGVKDSQGGDSHSCGEGTSDWGIVSRDGTAMIWCDSTMIGSIVFFLDLLDGIPQQSLTVREFRPALRREGSPSTRLV